MEVPRALSQIAEIHQHLAKGEVYRGYRSVPVAASGLVGLLAAILQPARASSEPGAFVLYWTAVAVLAAAVGLIEVVYNYVVHDERSARRRTRQVLGQFLPGAAAAGVATAGFHHVNPQLVALLPGIWAMCFGVGMFASRPYLPRLIGVVALFYFAAGALLLWTTDVGAPLSGWRIGTTFSLGQLMTAAVLYWELERPRPDGDDEP